MEYSIEYWETEEDRDLGFGEILPDSFEVFEDAKRVAEKMFFGKHAEACSAVEVMDENGEVVFGLYDEDGDEVVYE